VTALTKSKLGNVLPPSRVLISNFNLETRIMFQENTKATTTINGQAAEKADEETDSMALLALDAYFTMDSVGLLYYRWPSYRLGGP
jgi:hypothetical protein